MDRFVSRIRARLNLSCQNIHPFSPRTFCQIDKTPSACFQFSVLSDWMRHYLSPRLISAWSRLVWHRLSSRSLFPSFCFLSLTLRSENRYLFEIWVAVFCYQIHFRCTDESRVIVFQYYISDSLPRANPTLSPS